jgi:hypothetical protein
VLEEFALRKGDTRYHASLESSGGKKKALEMFNKIKNAALVDNIDIY